MKDFLGNEIPVHAPHKFDYNQKEISLTAIEQKSLLRGMGAAYEIMLQELRLVQRPSKSILGAIEKFENEKKEIDKLYGHYKFE